MKQEILTGEIAKELCGKLIQSDKECKDKSNFKKGYFKEKHRNWVAFDNSKGDCWTEDFRNAEEALIWLGAQEEAAKITEQKREIRDLLDAMYCIQQSVERMGLKSKEISYCNDLHDEILILYLDEEPDGDYQQEVFDDIETGERETLNYEETRMFILNRISNMLQTVEGI